jgi:hypothetical protein
MKMCDTVVLEWFSSCSSSSVGGTTAESVSISSNSNPDPGPHMPEPGAALLFGSAILIAATFKKLRRN